MKRIRMIDIAVLALVVLLVAFALAPAVARLQRTPAEAKCQSNLRQWAHAMDLYLSDNHGKYPTNRSRWGSGVNASVQLTPDEAVNADGSPRRFMYGISWVEALYPYVQAAAAKTGQDWKSVRQCPNASEKGQLPGGPLALTSRMTYSFNYNLIERPESIARRPGSLMMMREMDRRVNSVLRPTSPSLGPSLMPMTAFLTRTDSYISPATCVPGQHATGSYIVFADGHVRYFTTDFYPQSAKWDAETEQWYNFVYPSPANDTERMLNRSIAITP